MSLPALNRWLVTQAASWTPLLVLAAWLGWAGRFEPWMLWPVQLLMLASYLWLWRCLGSGAKVADIVTLLRFLGLLGVGAAVALAAQITWPIWVGMLVVVLGDLLDGWCARRFGGSESGVILDMETDQFTTLGLTILLAACTQAGLWLLLLPGFKYAYVLGMLAIGARAHDPKPRDGDNRRGRLICALVMTLLLACALPVMPDLVRKLCSLAAVVVLAYSFSSDAIFLWRHRPGARSAC
jgi:phosphatidylglycerophosphate synthase